LRCSSLDRRRDDRRRDGDVGHLGPRHRQRSLLLFRLVLADAARCADRGDECAQAADASDEAADARAGEHGPGVVEAAFKYVAVT